MAKAKVYVNQDSAITWGPLAGQGMRVADFDRASVLAHYKATDLLSFDVQWTVGERLLKTDSWDLGVQFALDKGRIPFYLRLHRGPMASLANYSQRQDMIGVGLRFSGFGL